MIMKQNTEENTKEERSTISEEIARAIVANAGWEDLSDATKIK